MNMRGYLGMSLQQQLMTGAAIVAVATASPAMAQTRNFNVEAQPASRGIPAFARQAGVQILASGNVVASRRTNAVHGSHTVDEGLRILLQGTGLSAGGRDGTGIITIRATLGSGEAQAVGAAADSESADEGATPEILVIGSRSQNVDIRRTENDPQPYVVYDSAEIQRSQATNLEDFLRRRLPMNTQVRSAGQTVATTPADNNNLSSITLRGLGPDQTLILVDGRRPARNVNFLNTNSTFIQSDINGIPISAIERIEVLPATAGGIYGGGAVGGVINIIRRRDYSGLDARIVYGGAFRGGGEQLRAEISGGFSPDHGDTQVSFSASHFEMRPLTAADNDLWRRARERYLAVNGYTNNSFQFFPGSTPNIWSNTFVGGVPQNLTLRNGTQLPSTFTSVPVGYAGPTTDNGAALVANAGRLNLDLANDVLGRNATLLNNPRVDTLNVNIRRSIGRNVDLFADFTADRNIGRSVFATTTAAIGIPAGAPGNPFQQAIIVGLPQIGLERPNINRAWALSGTGGFLARLGRSWTASAEYSWAMSSSTQTNYTNLLNPTVTAAYNNGILNAISDVNRFPLDYTPYLQATSPNSFRGPFRSYQQDMSARIAGPIFSLPGGDITATAIAGYRMERVNDLQLINPSSISVFPGRRQNDLFAYSELRAPIVSSGNNIPLLRSLELQASVRYDRYSTRVVSPTSYAYAPTTTPPTIALTYQTESLEATSFTIAGRWEPLRGLALRGSYATGFLPPNIGQLVSAPLTIPFFAGVLDPRRGNTQVLPPYQQIGGGNPDLVPETSRSLSFGAILTPPFVPGLRLSVDYVRITKRNEINGFNAFDIIANEAVFPGRILRDPLTAADSALGYTGGVVRSIDITLVNIARTQIQAWDFQADYERDIGRLGRVHLYAIASHQRQFERQLLPSVVPFDLVDYSGGPLRWRGNFGVEWTSGDWSAGWNAQYYDSYSVRQGTAPLGALSASAVAVQGAERIPSQIYHDLDIRYRFPPNSPSLLAGLELTLGIQNLFDRRPPVLATTRATGTYSTFGDPSLRRYTISVGRHF
jgi:iron complex outermembrane receptor protein